MDTKGQLPRRTGDDMDLKAFVMKVGLPGAIALGRVWLLGQRVDKGITDIQATLATHVIATQPLTQGLQQMVNLQLQNCLLNAGKDGAGRAACWAALTAPPPPRPAQ